MGAPKLQPGQKDGRVRAGRKPSEAETKTARLELKLRPSDLEFLKSQKPSATAWIEAKIQEAKRS